MFKILRHKNGQASMSQYVFVLTMSIGAIVALTVHVQRTLQARVRDTTHYMINNVQNITGVPIAIQYEPYYANVSTIVGRSRNEETRLLGGGATGIFRKTVDGYILVNTNSEQAPPKDVNKI